MLRGGAKGSRTSPGLSYVFAVSHHMVVSATDGPNTEDDVSRPRAKDRGEGLIFASELPSRLDL